MKIPTFAALLSIAVVLFLSSSSSFAQTIWAKGGARTEVSNCFLSATRAQGQNDKIPLKGANCLIRRSAYGSFVICEHEENVGAFTAPDGYTRGTNRAIAGDQEGSSESEANEVMKKLRPLYLGCQGSTRTLPDLHPIGKMVRIYRWGDDQRLGYTAEIVEILIPNSSYRVRVTHVDSGPFAQLNPSRCSGDEFLEKKLDEGKTIVVRASCFSK